MNPMELEKRYCAHNYEPLPVVLARGQGAHLWDIAGRRYIDMMSAYSAASHGHGHPRILAALAAQTARLAVPSRAYFNDKLGPFAAELCRLTGLYSMLPMNTGAEAVETAIKAARRWAYRVKGVAREKAEIIVAAGNFHGRTTTIIGFSSDGEYRDDFGPFTPGFRSVPFGDIAAMEAAIGANTAAVLIEPIQGEAGIIVPPPGYLAGLRALCDARNVLLIFDEVQSGLGRSGAWFAFEHEAARPDGLILGKALGGGVLPVSAFAGTKDLMAVFDPGSHGSTFGGNPLAAAVALEALHVIAEEGLVERSRELGAHMMERLRAIGSEALGEVRGRGLWAGAEISPAIASAREICERLLDKGVLSKETHDSVVRMAPPLVIGRDDLDRALDAFEDVLGETVRARRPGARARRAGTPGTAPAARFLMCRPEHFEVTYSINPWMDPGAWAREDGALARRADEEWHRLHRKLADLGARIELIDPLPGLPDLVFTANGAVVLDGTALLARFRYPQRQSEERIFAAAFAELRERGLVERIATLPDGMLLEGAGDCVWDSARQMFWMGHGPRSSKAAADFAARLFGVATQAMELVDPRFYHIDTALCPLPGGELVYVPHAFSPAGRAAIAARTTPDQRIELGEEDANRLAGNAVCIGTRLVMSSCGPGLRNRLAAAGYAVEEVPLTSFLRSGGSAFCLTLRLDAASAARARRGELITQ
ncbi:MAG: ornithine--oxo-acid transaminase [Rhodobiaceae bacterium]|nr:ornithine--oxo-acid transaminase [Rhodobiaceae bacterium]